MFVFQVPVVGAVGQGVVRDFLEQHAQVGVAGAFQLVVQAAQHVAAPLAEVHDLPGDSLGVQAQLHHVDGRLEELGLGRLEQQAHGVVRRDDVVEPVDHERGVGQVALQQQVERPPGGVHLGRIEGTRPVHGGVARGCQHGVALPQGDVQLLGQPQHHLAAGCGAPGLEKAQMARRQVGAVGQRLLAQVASLAPQPEVVAEGRGRHGAHRIGLAGAVALPCK